MEGTFEQDVAWEGFDRLFHRLDFYRRSEGEREWAGYQMFRGREWSCELEAGEYVVTLHACKDVARFTVPRSDAEPLHLSAGEAPPLGDVEIVFESSAAPPRLAWRRTWLPGTPEELVIVRDGRARFRAPLGPIELEERDLEVSPSVSLRWTLDVRPGPNELRLELPATTALEVELVGDRASETAWRAIEEEAPEALLGPFAASLRDGRLRFERIDPGTYPLHLPPLPGYRTTPVREVTVAAGTRRRIRVELRRLGPP